MKYSSIAIAAATLMLTVACQKSNSYTIEGTADEVADGDKMYLAASYDKPTPIDSAMVKDGKFTFTGNADDINEAFVYLGRRNDIFAHLIVEEGTIKVHASNKPERTKVGGTTSNEQLQVLNDSALSIGKQLNDIALAIYESNPSDGIKTEMRQRMEALHERFRQCVTELTERNIGNKFGYFMVKNFANREYMSDKKIKELIGRMPEEQRTRDEIRAIIDNLSQTITADEGQQFPELTMAAIDGTTMNITEEIRRNKITIIDFWASWCGPCMNEMPTIKKLYAECHKQGLEIIGISLDDNEHKWKDAVKSNKLEWKHVSDLKGWDNAAAKMFQVESIPQTFVVDSNGTILRKGLRGRELEEFVKPRIDN